MPSLASPLDAALAYAAMGLRVFPCHHIVTDKHGSRCSCSRSIRSQCDATPPSPGKHPRTAHGVKDATTDPEQIRAWWTSYPAANVAIATGDGLVVLDVDPRHNGDKTVATLFERNGRPSTVEVVSGSGGSHFYFKADGFVARNIGAAEGLDVMAANSYVLAPPSNHLSGGTYRWQDGSAPGEKELCVLPPWVRALSSAKPHRDDITPDKPIAIGARRQHLMDLAVRMRKVGATEAAILAGLVAEYDTHCEHTPPRSNGDLEGIAKWAAGNVDGSEGVAREPGQDWEAITPNASTEQRRESEAVLAPNASTVVHLCDAIDTAKSLFSRRFNGEEKPMPMPWPAVAKALGGGLWPGAHVVTGTTAAGKTAFAIQVSINAALAGHPVLYIGLELDTSQIVARLASMAMGESSGKVAAHWSDIYLGKADPRTTEEAIESLRPLPIYVEEAPPGGWSSRSMRKRVEALQLQHPGIAPLVVLDFLQLVGPTDPGGRREELRERIGTAAYAGREVARKCGAVVLMISSISRAGATELGKLAADQKLGSGDPADLVGLGKESGDIEFSADSVLSLAREKREEGDTGPAAVWLALAKIRAGVPTWCLLSFNGSWLEEAHGDATQHLEDRAAAARQAKEAAAAERRQKEYEARLKSILDTLARANGPMSVTTLNAKVGGAKDRFGGLLRELEARGLARQEMFGRKSLGWVLTGPQNAPPASSRVLPREDPGASGSNAPSRTLCNRGGGAAPLSDPTPAELDAYYTEMARQSAERAKAEAAAEDAQAAAIRQAVASGDDAALERLTGQPLPQPVEEPL